MTAVAVIDLHGGLGALHLARPFLYPLLSSGQLAWFAFEKSHPAVRCKQILRWLRRSQVSEYSLMVLVDTPDAGDDPVRNCLTEQLARLERDWLSVLRQAGRTPIAVDVIVLDQLARDPASREPLAPLARLRWELDAFGLTRTGRYDYLLFQEELSRLDQLWGSPIDLRAENIDGALSKLTDAKRGEVEDRIQKVRTELRKIIQMKCEAIDLRAGGAEEDIPFLSRSRYRAAEQEFNAKLERYQSDVKLLPAFSPSAELMETLRQQLGLASVATDWLLLRLPWAPSTDIVYADRLVALICLVLLLAESPRVFHELNDQGEGIHDVSIEFDRARLETLLRDWRKRMKTAQEHLERSASSREFQMDRFDHASCTREVSDDPLKIDSWTPDFLKPRGKPAGWSGWLKDTDGKLEEQWRAILKKAAKVTADVHVSETPPFSCAISDIHLETDSRRERLVDCRKALAGDVAPQPPEPLVRQTLTLSRKILAQQEIQPSAMALAACFAGGMLVLGSAYLAGLAVTHSYNPAELAMPAIVTVGLVALAVLIPAALNWQLMRRLSKEGAKLAKRVDRGLREILKHHVDRTRKLCELRAASRNMDAAQLVVVAEGRRNLREDYHRRQLPLHVATCERLMGTMPESAETGDRTRGRDFDFDLPVENNSLYWPISGEHAERDLQVTIGTATRRIHSRWAGAISAISISRPSPPISS